ncbi:MAG TPA: hypothetical protein VHL80_06770 [Polyangia bacterium]|nr:hypothetical protein [Polyangia bacterium]
MTRADGLRVLGLLAALATACATVKPAPVVHAPAPPPVAAPPPVRLAWMPLEANVSAEVASAVNQRLAGLAVAGVTEKVQATVSMEMAQLAIECIERTPRCYGEVGRSVGADRLAWAELARGSKRDASVTLRVSLFDVGAGAIIRQGARTFPNTKAARDGAAALFEGTFGAALASAGPAR